MNNQLNVTFGDIPDVQVIDMTNYHNANENEQRLLRLIESMEIIETVHDTVPNNEGSELGASHEFLSTLEEHDVDEELVNEKKECSICLESFKLGDKYIKLPCSGQNHIFHSDTDGCSGIKPWLSRNHTCPLCRTEFPRGPPNNTINANNTNNIINANNPIMNIISQIISENSSQLISNEEMDIQRAIELSLVNT